MTVNGVTAASSTTSTNSSNNSSAPSSLTKSLGADDFMKLLLAEMQNQDPMNPMSDTDFIAQLAQFNSLSQLTEINEATKTNTSNQNMAAGSSLLGKIVTGMSTTGTLIIGAVSGFTIEDNEVKLDVDGDKMTLGSVMSVQEPTTSEETTSN